MGHLCHLRSFGREVHASPRAEASTTLPSGSDRHKLRRALLLGLLSGGFITVASTAVSVVLALSGLVTLSLHKDIIYNLIIVLIIFSVEIMLAMRAYVSFCETRQSGDQAGCADRPV
jgi:hypothetical protein